MNKSVSQVARTTILLEIYEVFHRISIENQKNR